MTKQFVKALNKESDCFKYLCGVVQALSTEKLRSGIFDGPQIRRLMNDKRFVLSMTAVEKTLGFLIQLLLRILLAISKLLTTESWWMSYWIRFKS